MLAALWTAKPGSGCTTASVALAAAAAPRGEVLLVDLAGDLAAAVGVADPRHGVTDWLAAPDADLAAMARLERPVLGDRVRLLPLGSAAAWPADRSDALLELLLDERRRADRWIVVDVGTVSGRPGALDDLRRRVAGLDGALLVTRACYLAMRRARLAPVRPQGIVLVREERRTFDRHEVADAIGAPIVAQLDLDAAVARHLDAGHLLHRCPRRLRLQAGRVLR